MITLIIGGFVIAYKIMAMVFETFLVSALSGAFYAAMALSLNYPLTMNRMLLFAFLGSTLYMIFSLISSLASVLRKLVTIPKELLQPFLNLTKKLQTPQHVKNHKKLSSKVREYSDKVEELSKKLEDSYNVPEEDKSVSQDEEEHEVKEVVLNKVKNDKEDDEDDDGSEEFRI